MYPAHDIAVTLENIRNNMTEAQREAFTASDFANSIARDAAKKQQTMKDHDPVNHPRHYTNHPSGIECIEITRHMGFNLGNAIKYIWRADLKGGIEDLQKAIWYIQDEISKRNNYRITANEINEKVSQSIQSTGVSSEPKTYKTTGTHPTGCRCDQCLKAPLR